MEHNVVGNSTPTISARKDCTEISKYMKGLRCGVAVTFLFDLPVLREDIEN